MIRTLTQYELNEIQERLDEQNRFYQTCCNCDRECDEVEERYSFGVYAGRLCIACCSTYIDRCGLDDGQGDPTTLHEFEVGGWDAIEGE